ncbi:nuclear transport factor 2 family protein [Rhodococcus sp. NPDC003318]|uniref:nuclear transport factor 2 family protein n=1 Tax=Rhodococcus sp. NPDC003318 TaxID=3364503 RepID=UPI0036C542D4
MTDTRDTDLATRIETLEQIEAIKALKHRYWRACDAKDPTTFRACFVRRGASIDYGRLGAFEDADPMAEIFTRVALHTVDGRHVVYDMHHGMHPEITVTGPGTATGRWTLRFRQVNLLDNTEKLMTGEYDDEYVLEDGAWRMSKCHFTETWAMIRPLPEGTTVTSGAFVGVTR